MMMMIMMGEVRCVAWVSSGGYLSNLVTNLIMASLDCCSSTSPPIILMEMELGLS
jgi:hypothetical protein